MNKVNQLTRMGSDRIGMTIDQDIIQKETSCEIVLKTNMFRKIKF